MTMNLHQSFIFIHLLKHDTLGSVLLYFYQNLSDKGANKFVLLKSLLPFQMMNRTMLICYLFEGVWGGCVPPKLEVKCERGILG